MNTKLAKGKKSRGAEKAPGKERAPTVPVPGVPRTEEERARAATLAKIVDAMIDPIFVLDLEGRCVFANRAYFQMFGLEPKDIMGKSIVEIPGVEKQKPEVVEKLMPLFEETIERGSAGPVELVLVSMDGREIPLSITGGMIKDAQGNPTHIVAVLRDITELKRAEEQLRESEARSRLILQTMPSGLFTVNLDRRITSWSKGAEKITGLKAEQVIGKTCLETLDCDECKKGCAFFDDKVDKPIYGKECAMHVDGRDIIVSKNADILKDSEGNTIGSLENFVDITERKKAEEEKLKVAADKQRMEELEKFAKIAVGRELKMVELKDRIKALELRLEGITEKG